MMGFLLSFTVVAYTASDITLAFIFSAEMLIGVIVSGVFNFFLGSTMVIFLTSIISVIIFSGLIAWDNKKLEQVYRQNNGNVYNVWAISMALSLYLDFINLFITLLRLIRFTRNNQD